MGGDEIERSESGSPIYRHEAKERDVQAPQNPGLHLDEIEAHLEQHVGKVESVLHEIVSDLVHIDLLCVPPRDDGGPLVIVTSGVSDEPMHAPEGYEALARAELLLPLPADWPLDPQDLQDERHYWPLRWLKAIGRLPHEFESWIAHGHTIPNGDPAETIADTPFTGFMLMPAYWLPENFYQLETKSGETITFYELVPLHPDEMEFKLKHGAGDLEDRLCDLQDKGLLTDPTRPSVVGA